MTDQDKTSKEQTDQQTEQVERTTAMEFPCDFVIKMMGKNNVEFIEKAHEIIFKHFPEQKNNISFKKVPSKDNNYLAISAKVKAENKQQMDNCYHALTGEPLVLIAL